MRTLILALALASAAFAQTVDRPVLTLAGARAALAAAEAEAVKRGLKVSIAIVDPAGVPILQQRMDDATMVGPDIALGKARTAAGFNQPTAVLENRLQKEGALRLLSLPGLMVEGGVLVKISGRTVAAIGVSGATSAEDGLIAAAGAAALSK
jgi:glc operon protein GlcG